MKRLFRFRSASPTAENRASLERRITISLVLVVLCMGMLFLVSQDRAARMLDQSESLHQAAANADHAEHLTIDVARFRTASAAFLDSDGDHRDLEGLADIGILIGERVNELRLGYFRMANDDDPFAAFANIDRQTASLQAAVKDRQAQVIAVTDSKNQQMSESALAIRAHAQRQRDAVQARLGRGARDWQRINLVVGALAGLLLALIVFDIMHNIMPALRRMHVSLKRLSEGDLNFEVESFHHRELKVLSGSLETFRKNAVAVRDLAFTDSSTGLPNRRAFVDGVSRFLDEATNPASRDCAVIVVDLDRFKHVNDDFGHATGDCLMRQIGERMIHSLGPDSLVARIGGDEFAVFVPLGDGENAIATVAGLQGEMRAPFDLDGLQVAVTMSFGYVQPDPGNDGNDINALLARADLALYAAKAAGRNCARQFRPEFAEQRELERTLERDLESALAAGDIRVVYQPIHEADDPEHGLNEVEALARWHHPEMGELSPARFVPAAERSGQMPLLGAWIVERALRDLRLWPDLTLSLNLSPIQLQQEGFAGFILKACRDNFILPTRVILEVTETLSIERNTKALTTLEVLRGLGFRIALDDFGTGYSSLCLMKTFRFDRLKLDRTLIEDIERDNSSRAVFNAAVTMARSLGAEVVAEGISTPDLLRPVREAGCTHVQGFYFSRPIESIEVARYFRNLGTRLSLRSLRPKQRGDRAAA